MKVMVEMVEFRKGGKGPHMSENVLTKMTCSYVFSARRFGATVASAA